MLSLINLFIVVQAVLAAPLARRDFETTSPMFTLVAFHRGREFQYNMVKYNGTHLELARDEPAFFGHIEADSGYTLTIPQMSLGPNTAPLMNVIDLIEYSYEEANVTVASDGKLVTKAGEASSHFGIENSLLTYKNSSSFMACPVWTAKNSTWGLHNWTGHHNSSWAKEHKNVSAIWNQNASVSDSWSNATMVYGTNITTNATWLDHFKTFDLHAGSMCPDNVPGHEISLIVQVAAQLNFNPDSNSWDGDESGSDSGSSSGSMFKRLLEYMA